ncbi:MAG: dipeptidase PepE [Gemmatimonadaceae bacterium]|nr:dipeptidase PepE [Gemmatimonadaceae bacterium]
MHVSPARTPRLLLLSNSRAPDGAYLRWPADEIRDFLGPSRRSAVFVPYAAVPGTPSVYDGYTARVREAFANVGVSITSVHEAPDPVAAVRSADVIVVGGGNTFHLLTQLYITGLRDAIQAAVRAGTPYIGWSAGSNVACPTISTTNDMPIIQPPSFDALGLVPFQINPHYTDAHPPGHQGETRAERIAELLALHPSIAVVGLREGTLLRVEGDAVRLAGVGARVFRAGCEPVEHTSTAWTNVHAIGAA